MKTIDISELAARYDGKLEDEFELAKNTNADLPDEFWDRVDLEYERRRDGWYDY